MENNGQVVHADERSFKDVVLDAQQPCLVDFWAPWCGPCRVIGPLLEEIAREYEGRVRVVKVNVDESPALAGGYGIRSIPSLLFISGGEVKDSRVGSLPRSQLAAFIERNMS